MKHRCEIWYLELNRKYIMKQISIVWIVRYWRECKSHHDLITSLWISEFSDIFCDINDSISIIRYVSDVSQTENDREIDKKRNVSMQRMQNRVFLTWLRSVRESDRLVCEKIRYFQHYLSFLIEFLLSSWSSFCFAKSRCNNCIIRFFETILCDFIVVSVQYAFSKLYCRICNDCIVRFFETILCDVKSSFECVMTE